MSTAAITIPNTLPGVIVALSGDTAALIRDIEIEAAGIAVVTSDTFQAADTLVSRAIKLDKAIEAERKKLKAPITELAQALDDAAGEARAGLLAVKSALGSQILAFTTEENRRREEERRRLEEQRRQAEEQARLAREEEERKRKEAEAKPVPAVPVAPWDEVDDPAPAVPVVMVNAPTIEQQMAAAPIKSSSVVQKTIKRVEVTDPALVPRELAGVHLWTIDQKAIERLAKAGVQIPGVTVSEVTITAAKG